MSYTKEQYDMLEGFEYGILFSALSESEKQIFWFLDQQGLLLAKSDIEDGLFFLSEKGKSVLTEHRMNLQKAEQEARQLAEKEAAEKKSKASDRLFEVFLVILGYALGYATDHVSEIVGFIRGLFG